VPVSCFELPIANCPSPSGPPDAMIKRRNGPRDPVRNHQLTQRSRSGETGLELPILKGGKARGISGMRKESINPYINITAINICQL
jgi:hypothetical protein